jgi:hypothetical protein
MRGYFGFPGDVSFQPQLRIKAAYRGCDNITGVPLELSGVQALPSGSYRGAPGVRANQGKGSVMIRQRDQHMAMFYAMGIPLTGPSGRRRLVESVSLRRDRAFAAVSHSGRTEHAHPAA